MNIFDRLFFGNIIQDFGVIRVDSQTIVKTTYRALLQEAYGEYFFIIKMTSVSPFGVGLSGYRFSLNEAGKIRQFVMDAEQLVQTLPPVNVDINRIGLTKMLITFAIACGITVLVGYDSALSIIAAFIATLFQSGFYEGFKTHHGLDAKTKTLLMLIGLLTLALTIILIIINIKTSVQSI